MVFCGFGMDRDFRAPSAGGGEPGGAQPNPPKCGVLGSGRNTSPTVGFCHELTPVQGFSPLSSGTDQKRQTSQQHTSRNTSRETGHRLKPATPQSAEHTACRSQRHLSGDLKHGKDTQPCNPLSLLARSWVFITHEEEHRLSTAFVSLMCWEAKLSMCAQP